MEALGGNAHTIGLAGGRLHWPAAPRLECLQRLFDIGDLTGGNGVPDTEPLRSTDLRRLWHQCSLTTDGPHGIGSAATPVSSRVSRTAAASEVSCGLAPPAGSDQPFRLSCTSRTCSKRAYGAAIRLDAVDAAQRAQRFCVNIQDQRPQLGGLRLCYELLHLGGDSGI
ncbi:hypothetical protein WJX72_002848 [[Myrmecia] bisecta]|uniref:Uncharacterized protein n=1 Tax=[Myrmecia] bisecta TaxID=41462 RepID=A0AAW1PCW0_9CHLO